MRSVLDRWIFSIPHFLQQKLARSVELVPAQTLPPSSSAVALLVFTPDNSGERFLVIAEPSELHSFLIEAGLAGPEPDFPRDFGLWRSLVKEATAAAFSVETVEDVNVQEVRWPSTTSLAGYELHLGSIRLRL